MHYTMNTRGRDGDCLHGKPGRRGHQVANGGVHRYVQRRQNVDAEVSDNQGLRFEDTHDCYQLCPYSIAPRSLGV